MPPVRRPSSRRSLLAALPALLLAGSFPSRADELPADVTALREHVRKLEETLERTVGDRDRAIDDLEAERSAAKRALDRVLEQSVEREGKLAVAARREAALEKDLEAAAAEQARTLEAAAEERERLLEEIVAQAETRGRERVEERLQRALLLDRMRTIELERDEAARLGDEARHLTASLAEEADHLRSRLLELEHQLAQATTRDEAEKPKAVSSLEAELDETRRKAGRLHGDLETARRELRALRTAREGLEKALVEARARRASPARGEAEDEAAGADPDAEELARQLALERERRATLEGELVRLSVSSETADRYRELWHALQSARAEIFVLRERLDEERSTREELQTLLARAREAANARGGSDPESLERLIEVAEIHGEDTERLEADLRDANDHIARLRGLLETIEAPDGTGTVIASLEEENERLRESLTAAEQRVGRLSGQAALARRLAEIVYNRSP